MLKELQPCAVKLQSLRNSISWVSIHFNCILLYYSISWVAIHLDISTHQDKLTIVLSASIFRIVKGDGVLTWT